MGMGVCPAERAKRSQAPIKLAQPFMAPESRAGESRISGFFWTWETQRQEEHVVGEDVKHKARAHQIHLNTWHPRDRHMNCSEQLARNLWC